MTIRHHAEELAQGDRFKFGANWARFLKVLNEERIAHAKGSLQEMLEVQDLQGLDEPVVASQPAVSASHIPPNADSIANSARPCWRCCWVR